MAESAYLDTSWKCTSIPRLWNIMNHSHSELDPWIQLLIDSSRESTWHNLPWQWSVKTHPTHTETNLNKCSTSLNVLYNAWVRRTCYLLDTTDTNSEYKTYPCQPPCGSHSTESQTGSLSFPCGLRACAQWPKYSITCKTVGGAWHMARQVLHMELICIIYSPRQAQMQS